MRTWCRGDVRENPSPYSFTENGTDPTSWLIVSFGEAYSPTVLLLCGAACCMMDMIEIPLESHHTDAPYHPNSSPAADRPMAPDRVHPTSESYFKGAPERLGGMPRTGERSGQTPPEPCAGPRRQGPVSDDVSGQSLTGGPPPPVRHIVAALVCVMSWAVKSHTRLPRSMPPEVAHFPLPHQK